jgi:hypothetical protein
MMGEEHCVEDLNQDGYRSLGKMLQGPTRGRFLVDLETPDGFLDLIRVG